MTVGKYTLTWSNGQLWIYLTDDGEGGVFNEAALEAVIEKFYNENF